MMCDQVPENVRALNAEDVDRSQRRAAWLGRRLLPCWRP
jgi:hypothetical protein